MNYFSLFYYLVGVAIIFDIGFRLYQHFKKNGSVSNAVADVTLALGHLHDEFDHRVSALEHYIAINIDIKPISNVNASVVANVVSTNG